MGAAGPGASRLRLLLLLGMLAVGLALLGARALRSSAPPEPGPSTVAPPRPSAPDDPAHIAQRQFDEGKYEEIERLTESLFASQALDPQGDWELANVYATLDRPPDGDHAPEEAWKAHLARLEEWEKRLPASATALALHGETMVKYAWRARGSGFADSVSRDGWAVFGERLVQARALLERALLLPRPVPLVYVGLLTVGLGQGWPREQMEALLERAVTLAPTYPDFYLQMAIYLLPRWHGKPGDWQRFAEVSAQRTKSQLGMSLYARIFRCVYNYVGPEEALHPNYLSWSKLREGWRELEKRCENKDWFREMRGRSACQFGDRAESNDIFAQMGNGMFLDVWESREALNDWENWARQPAGSEEVEAHLKESLMPVDLRKAHVLNLLQQIRERVTLGFAIDDTVCRPPNGIDLQKNLMTIDQDEISVGDLLRPVLAQQGLGYVIVAGTVLISTPDRLKIARDSIRSIDAALQKSASADLLPKLDEFYQVNWTLLSTAKGCERLTKMSGIPIRVDDPTLRERRIWLQIESQYFRSVLSLIAFQLDATWSLDGAGLVLAARGK